MSKQRSVLLAKALVVAAIAFVGQAARAQYTGEFVICTDGSSPDACRATAIPPDDSGVVTWGRDLGSTLCAGVGFIPQDTECRFLGASYNGFDCRPGFTQDIFGARVAAGGDLAIACGDIAPLFNGNYSAKTTSNTCGFDETATVCQPFIITDITPTRASPDQN